jgi:Tfp pilus assembly protein PilV
MSTKRTLSRIGCRFRSEEGFTVIETVVALGVILAALVSLAFTATIGFSHIAAGRHRQTATGLANQAMEQVRALPFDTLKKGLKNSDLSSLADPKIVKSGTEYFFNGEQIPRGDNANVVPLVPHQQTVTSGTAAVYTISTYVTYYNNVLTDNTLRVTVRVDWTANGKTGSMQAESIFYSGSGCLSTATHPFAAPCQPFFFTSAYASEGLIAITGSVSEMTFTEADLRPGGATSDLQVEQLSATQGTTETSGVTLIQGVGVKESLGLQKVTSGADNDPGQDLSLEYESNSVPAQSAQTIQITGIGGSVMSAVVSGDDDGDTASTTSASISPPNNCANLVGTYQTDQLPCGSSSAQQQGTAYITLQLYKNAKKLGDIQLAWLDKPTASSIGYTNRAVTPEIGVCTATTGVGCVRAEVVHSWGELRLADFPSDLSKPAGWQGYLVKLTGATASGTAEAGIGTTGPTGSLAGTAWAWNGVGYTPISVAVGGIPIPVTPVSYTTTVDGHVVKIAMTASLTTGHVTLSDPAGCVIACTREDASAQIESPILGSITYTITYDTVQIVSLTYAVDLGLTLARSTYQPAPSSG